jgi:hypothetical protein
LTDQEQVRDQSLANSVANRVPQQAPLGPRIAGLAILCLTLFGLATLFGLFANAVA